MKCQEVRGRIEEDQCNVFIGQLDKYSSGKSNTVVSSSTVSLNNDRIITGNQPIMIAILSSMTNTY